MPTPEVTGLPLAQQEIKSICTEYVDELFAHDDMQDQENIEAKNDAFVMCMAFAGHILEKHCIVPKEQIYMRHGVAHALIEQDPVHKEFYRGQSSALESIFGTALFNEEKE